MSDALARDQREAESTDSDQALIVRRRSRDEQDYRDWCEGSYETVRLGQEEFHPADVFDRLAPDAARRGRDEASAQARADLEQTVCEHFSAPIAVQFHGFLEGPRQPLQRLHRLRDAWESLVRLLAALALSEAARSVSSLAPLIIREGRDQRWRTCKARDLRTDKLAIRIGLIEGVVRQAQEVGVGLQVASLVPIELIAEIRRLNVVRNGFSHEATKSDAQANAIIDEAYPMVREILLDLRDMQNVELFRIPSIQAGGRVEVEKLTGHAQSRRIHEEVFDSEAAALALSAAPVDGMSRVLARARGVALDLSPFLYADDDDTGHRTRIFQYKGNKGGKWQMECVADSTTKTSPAAQHETLLEPFEKLFGRSREGRDD